MLFIRVPFQIPSALLRPGTPKLLHVAGNPYNVIAASSDYHGLMKLRRAGVRGTLHSTSTPHGGRAADPGRHNGGEMWDVMACRQAGPSCRLFVSLRGEMRPRDDRSLGNPPRLLFVGYLRPEKGIHTFLDAFEQSAQHGP